MERWFTPAFRESRPLGVETARHTLLATSPDGYIACVAALRDMDLRVELGSIRSRTLVIAGHLDPATPPAMGRTIADAIDGARFIELLASHLSNIEAPEAFNAAVLDLLLS
jgi:3-oxoadipate enol-lactonase